MASASKMDSLDVLAPRTGTPMCSWFSCCLPDTKNSGKQQHTGKRCIMVDKRAAARDNNCKLTLLDMDDLTATESTDSCEQVLVEESSPDNDDAMAHNTDYFATRTIRYEAEDDNDDVCFHETAATTATSEDDFFHDAVAIENSEPEKQTKKNAVDPPPSSSSSSLITTTRDTELATTTTTYAAYTKEVLNVIMTVLCLNLLVQLWPWNHRTNITSCKPPSPPLKDAEALSEPSSK